MARAYLIIDGYNLLHAAGFARDRYGPGQLERCRMRLLGYLSRHITARDRERTTVVFDATGAPPDLPREARFAGMRIRFARPGRDADETIEELISAHSSPRQIFLVSSDHRLQKSARKRRGLFTDSEEFIRTLERRGPVYADLPGTTPPADSSHPEKDDVAASSPRRAANDDFSAEDWLQVFGEVSEAAEFEPAGPAISDADVAAIQEEIEREETTASPKHWRRRGRKKN